MSYLKSRPRLRMRSGIPELTFFALRHLLSDFVYRLQFRQCFLALVLTAFAFLRGTSTADRSFSRRGRRFRPHTNYLLTTTSITISVTLLGVAAIENATLGNVRARKRFRTEVDAIPHPRHDVPQSYFSDPFLRKSP